MKQLTIGVILVLLAYGCNQKVTNDLAQLDGKELLENAVKAHGEQLYTGATVRFMMNENDFDLKRDGYNYRYEMSRQTDTATHTAVTYNGGFEFLIDGELVSQGSRMEVIIRNRLSAVAYDFYLPFELLANDAIHRYLGTEIVRGKEYHKVEVTFKQIDIEVPDNRIIMFWIDVKTNEIDFIAKQDGGRETRKQFMAAANKRRQNGLLISDFETYRTKNLNKDVAIDSLGYYYNLGAMQLGRSIIYKNSEVILKK